MDQKIIQTEKALTGNGFQVSCFETKEEAAAYLSEEIKGKTVGFGGSETVREMNLYEILSRNNQVAWHWVLPEGKTVTEMRKASSGSEIYFSSANAIAETGEIINIDGTGNRVAATIYGCRKVYIVAGVNKIEKDFDSALWRARNIAAPKNAKKLGRKTPCAQKADHCYNCQSPERICNALTVLWKKPGGCDYEVILINEELGL